MARTNYGYLHSHYGPDMDGCSRSFERVEDRPMDGDPNPAGWFAMCEIEPDVGWIGPFDTEEVAILAATSEKDFVAYQYGEDPLGDHHGRNV